jgi:hypothetical protein
MVVWDIPDPLQLQIRSLRFKNFPKLQITKGPNLGPFLFRELTEFNFTEHFPMHAFSGPGTFFPSGGERYLAPIFSWQGQRVRGPRVSVMNFLSGPKINNENPLPFGV